MISSAAVEDVETSVVSKKRHPGVKRNLLGIFGKEFFWEDALFYQWGVLIVVSDS